MDIYGDNLLHIFTETNLDNSLLDSEGRMKYYDNKGKSCSKPGCNKKAMNIHIRKAHPTWAGAGGQKRKKKKK